MAAPPSDSGAAQATFSETAVGLDTTNWRGALGACVVIAEAALIGTTAASRAATPMTESARMKRDMVAVP